MNKEVSPSQTYSGLQHQIKALVQMIVSATIRAVGTSNFTAIQCIEGLSEAYNFTSATIRQIIARNPDYTLSMKAEPLVTILRETIPKLPMNVQQIMYSDMFDDSLEPVVAQKLVPMMKDEQYTYAPENPSAEGTQTMTPPETPRPASDDKRDFDRPNAPPRPSTDRDDPSGLSDANEYQRLALCTESRKAALLLQEYQAYETGTAKQAHDKLSRLLHGAIGCCTEAGELQDMLKKHLFYGKPLDLVNVMEECGDLLWYIAITLDAAGYTMFHAMERNIAKLKKRYPEKFTSEKALNRDLVTERQTLEGLTNHNENGESFLCNGVCIDPARVTFPPGTIGSELKYDPESDTSYDVHSRVPASGV